MGAWLSRKRADPTGGIRTISFHPAGNGSIVVEKNGRPNGTVNGRGRHVQMESQWNKTNGAPVENGYHRGVQTGSTPGLADSGVRQGNGVGRTVPPDEVKGSKELEPKAKPKQKHLRIQNLLDGKQYTDTLHRMAQNEAPCDERRCLGSIMFPTKDKTRDRGEMLLQAEDFIRQYYTHVKRANTPPHKERWAEVKASIEATGTYDLTEAELTFGAKTAWRNASRCIGRIQWTKLKVFDARDATTSGDMFDAICRHMRYATNEGNLRSAITVFPHRTDGRSDFRVWNSQLIRYACYKQPDGSLVGDPANLEFTEICQKLGWKGEGGAWDVLPLVLQARDSEPEMFDIPRDLILEVHITHPSYDWFAELGLRWYTLPAIASLMLDVGGLQFPGVPFNGWYMVTEIGTRDFCDENRLNMCEPIAKRMGLDTSTHATLWKDRAVVEANVAVMYSFQKANVTMTDHHSASDSFIKHMENEQRLRGGCPADWVWVVPPTSGSITQVFHQEMIVYNLKPSYEYQEDAWKNYRFEAAEGYMDTKKRRSTLKEIATMVMFATSLMRGALAKRTKATILYATETGRSETFSKMLHATFMRAFDAKVMCMEDYDTANLRHESLVLVVASTFGNGDAPENGETFRQFLAEHTRDRRSGDDKNIERGSDGEVLPEDETSPPLKNVRYSVFGLGSTAYPNFAAFARTIDTLMDDMGGERILAMGEGDELGGQEKSFREWAKEVFQVACETFSVAKDVAMNGESEPLGELGWTPDKFRLIPESGTEPELCEALAKLHRKTILPCRLISSTNLHSEGSSRSTIRVEMDTQGASDLEYQPGDHAAICPANEEVLVESVLNRMNSDVQPDDVVALQVLQAQSTPTGLMEDWNKSTRLPPCSIRHALTYYLDITTAPSPNYLRLLASQATDPKEREKLIRLGEGSVIYNDWRYRKSPNLVEVLEEFPSVELSASFLLQETPLLRPRYYSISSSPQMYPGEIHLTVGVVFWKNRSAKSPPHNGVCSSWLNTLTEGEVIPTFVRRSPLFRLPERKELPSILVGPGTGIAPFRSFWQQRQFDLESKNGGGSNEPLGSIYMFFGCRHPDVDNIYAEEREEAIRNKALKEVHVAFSRGEGTAKKYVQNSVYDHAERVFNIIDKEEGHFYVCGDVYMAEDVQSTLERIICEQSHLNVEQAREYVRKMKDQARYHEDIFGITQGRSMLRSEIRRQSRIRVSRVSRSLRPNGIGSPAPVLEKTE